MAYITKTSVATKRELLKNLFPEYKFSVKKRHSTSVSVTMLESPAPILYTQEIETTLRTDKDGLKGQSVKNAESCIGLTTFSHHPQYNIYKMIVEGLGNWNNSDAQFDYFDVGYYSFDYIGDYEKPLQVKRRSVPKKLQGSPKMEVIGDGIIKFSRGSYVAYTIGRDLVTEDELLEIKKKELLEKIVG